jgi:chromosome segregation ATPase
VTTRREVPLTGDTLAWVHSEIAEIKSRLSIIAQMADQSRSLATDAADTAHHARTALGQFDGIGPAIQHLQDDLRSLRELLARSQDDINALRQTRDETERRLLAESEVNRQDKNDTGRRFNDIERHIETWMERQAGAEEHYRRNLEAASQLAMRIEAVERQVADADNGQSRTVSSLSRIEQEIQRISSVVLALLSEENTQRERHNTTGEMIRRLETELELMRTETNKIIRIDDRLELVQAERTRHNERLNEITAELAKIDVRLNENDERASLIEARIMSYQDDLRKLREKLQTEREQLASYLQGLREMQADFRKRDITAIEKEIREIRGRAFDITPE